MNELKCMSWRELLCDYATTSSHATRFNNVSSRTSPVSDGFDSKRRYLPRIVSGNQVTISGYTVKIAITINIKNTYGVEPATISENFAPPEMP
jgi:hypothetical protein